MQNWSFCTRLSTRPSQRWTEQNRRSVLLRSGTLIAQRDDRWSQPSREIRRSARFRSLLLFRPRSRRTLFQAGGRTAALPSMRD